MFLVFSGGGRRPSVSQNSNDGIGGGDDGMLKGILVLIGMLVAFFLLLYLFG